MAIKFFKACLLGGTVILGIARTWAEPTGFESTEGFSVGSDVAKRAAWVESAEGAGRISDVVSSAGRQSLELEPGAGVVTTAFDPGKAKVVFVDFAIRPVADASETPQYAVDANGARIGFLLKGDGSGEGTVVAVPDSRKAAVATARDFSVDEAGVAVDWVRITIREDLAARNWDLFVNGELALVDQPLEKTSDAFRVSFYAAPEGRAFLDDVTIGAENPLFLDADKDGIPDAVELVIGSNPYFDDRQVDFNGDGVANIRNLQRGTPLGNPRTQARIIYVDGQNGDDLHSGENSYRAAGRSGPKATLRSAILDANNETTIAIFPARESYTLVEKTKGDDSNIIRIVPLGDIHLKTE